MLRIREQQQEIANQKAKEAAAKRKEKEAEERQRKNKVAQRDTTNKGEGRPLGGSSSDAGGGYNPMQPFSGTSRGYRYVVVEFGRGVAECLLRRNSWLTVDLFSVVSRPARRTVRRS